MAYNVNLPRRAVWLIAVCMLIMAFLINFEKVENKAEHTAMVVTAKNILERANYYKQYWYLNGNPQKDTLEGMQVRFNNNGWVLPDSDDDLKCEEWLTILHPQHTVFGKTEPEWSISKQDSDIFCAYNYQQRNLLVMQIINGQFSVNVEFLLEEPEANR